MSKIKMPSVSELMRRFEAKHGYEPTAEELSDAWFSGELDTDTRSAKEHTRQGQGSSRRPRRQVLPGAIKKPGDALRDEQ